MSAEPLARPWSRTDRPVPRRVVQPLQRFLHTEVTGGLVLLVAAIIALGWANSPWAASYEHLWHIPVAVGVGGWTLELSLHHWVNDLAMAVFFFVVGLEIKREVVHGELRDRRAAALPVVAALGGMVVPALLYTLVARGGAGASGWGIPMATDIAFAVGVLALVGRRAPAGLKVFLLTLAVADDLGAIVVIALFYASGIQATWLGVAAASLAAVVVLQRLHVRWLAPYVALAAVLWIATLESGVHATIAGVALGLATPAHPFHLPRAAAPRLAELDMPEAAGVAREAVSPLARLETLLHPWTAYVVLPLFALANAGVAIPTEGVGAVLASPVTVGVALGLVGGKPLGIMAATWIAVRLGIGRLPQGVGWSQVAGAGLLGGIGFTVALFVAGLAFTDEGLVDAAKVGILGASVLAGVAGAGLLTLAGAHRRPPVVDPPLAERHEPALVG